MTQCQRCAAKAQLFLCNNHITELRDMFADLPRLANHLAEAATGQARLGERSRRSRSDDSPMRVNLKASDLLDQVNATLVRWVRDICDSRGVTYRALRIVAPSLECDLEPDEVRSEYDGDTAKLALWLAKHVDSVAADESAGMCFDEIHAHIGRILVTINRPIPPRFCGPCPTPDPVDDRRQCGMALMAKRDAVEVRCPQCSSTHNVELLMRRLLADVDHWRFTRKEVLLIMSTLGDKLSERTFQHWRKHNVVRPRGYRRPDGRISLTRHSDRDEPVYRLSDVRSAGRSAASKTKESEVHR